MPRHHVVDFSARIKRAQNKSSSEVGVARRRRRNRQIHESCGDWPEASVLLFVDSRKPARFYGRIERSVIYPTRDSLDGNVRKRTSGQSAATFRKRRIVNSARNTRYALTWAPCQLIWAPGVSRISDVLRFNRRVGAKTSP